MLACQERCRHYDGDLLAAHRCDERGPQRDLGLAKPDVAADQPVHRTPGCEITQDDIDCSLLIVGFLVGKAGTEFVVWPDRGREARSFPQLPLSRDLDQRARHFADALFHACLARLPGGAPETIELDRCFFRSVARQKLDVLDRQEQLVAGGVMNFQTVVRCACRLDVRKTGESPDAVVDVNHKIAGRKTGDLGNEILGPSGGAPRAHQTVAEDVLFGNDRQVRGLETGFKSQHRQRDVGFRPGQRFGPTRDRNQIVKPVVGEHVAQSAAWRASTSAHTALKTLRSCWARSGAKLRPGRVSVSIRSGPRSGAANDVSRTCAAALSRWGHSASPR